MAYLQGDAESQGTKGKKLTPKMISFIDAYFNEANFNAVKAYQLSDYANTSQAYTTLCKNAAELMNHPLIRKEVERRTAARTERSEVKAEYLINKLMQIIEAEQDRNPNAALRAVELAGKSIALWKERQEITGADGEAIKHEQHVKESVADFTSRISGLAKRAGTEANVVQLRPTVD